MLPLHTSSDLPEWPHPETRSEPGMPRQDEGSTHPFPGLLLHLNYPVSPSSEPPIWEGLGKDQEKRDSSIRSCTAMKVVPTVLLLCIFSSANDLNC